MKTIVLILLLIAAEALSISARAEEGGSAHYMPGAAASFIDAFPAKPGGLAVLNYFTIIMRARRRIARCRWVVCSRLTLMPRPTPIQSRPFTKPHGACSAVA